MKHIKYKIDLTGFLLGAASELEQFMLKAAAQALQDIFELDETFIYFPDEWDVGMDGKPPSDPTTMHLCLGNLTGGEEATFSFSLSSVVDQFIRDSVTADGKIYEEHVPSAKALSNGLKDLAKRIDDAFE